MSPGLAPRAWSAGQGTHPERLEHPAPPEILAMKQGPVPVKQGPVPVKQGPVPVKISARDTLM